MPRKKSAAKKAKEAAKKAELEAQAAVIEDVPEENHTASDEESTSEEEDDYGELITEDVEEGIKNVLEAIRTKDTSELLNPTVRFFEEPEAAVAKLAQAERHKPIYLKDYHRMNLLAGETFAKDGEDFETMDGKPSFAAEQRQERAQILAEINEEVGKAEEDDEDEFLTKKKPSSEVAQKTALPDPSVDDEQFLQAFVEQQAWIPRKGDKTVDLDRGEAFEEDDKEFEDAVEQFETAYNFRYEDPNAAEIVSYARTQATIRRSAASTRKRKRDEEKQEKDKDRQEREKAIQKKKKETVYQLSDVLDKIRKEYGAEISEPMVQKLTATLLNGSYDDSKWDEVVGELFDEEFYQQEGKPTWDENDEIMGDFYAGNADDDDDAAPTEDHANGEKEKKSKKEGTKEKKAKKQEKKELRNIIEESVEQNKLALIEKVEEERGRTKEKDLDIKFRYREVSPESFGLTTREIFMADDAALNEYIGLKKFAPYRAKELRNKDKRKVMKAKRLKEWRKKVFNNENGLADEDEALDTQAAPKKEKSRSKHKTSK
ncbi:ADL170Cp [Eremothecium gossypii ATCC 10895]|uniref:ADL170Cp n=1 Tax=Eremothecium gossypii (strain ATCC 10895 / CBS 109.51 / FGSC 9923 / NRRL Y-1056) TaxID=284811 RepID=Q75AU0_EREGS|nr:ADL170Cp [Eremothecium gossypii ATCC 10895]AAS51750.2 ADL170Cp [Eremothecium gossypii ATCC 10895]AEY96047.1 FADL170Cp [Eremothecium gossypii FDAG1]